MIEAEATISRDRGFRNPGLVPRTTPPVEDGVASSVILISAHVSFKIGTESPDALSFLSAPGGTEPKAMTKTA